MTEMTNPTEASERTPLTDAVLAQIPSTMDTQLDADFMNIMVRHARDLERALTAAKAELAKAEAAAKIREETMLILLRQGAEDFKRAEKAEAELAEKAVDAARYRWLRERWGKHFGSANITWTLPLGTSLMDNEEEFDKSIDAARGKP